MAYTGSDNPLAQRSGMELYYYVRKQDSSMPASWEMLTEDEQRVYVWASMHNAEHVAEWNREGKLDDKEQYLMQSCLFIANRMKDAALPGRNMINLIAKLAELCGFSSDSRFDLENED